jgi:methionyl-tRNA synthetase
MKSSRIPRSYARKAWEVVGYTMAGWVYCPAHMPNYTDRPGNEPAPIFVSDDYEGMTCDKCGEVIS